MPIIEHRIAIREKAHAKIKQIRDKNLLASAGDKSDDSAIDSINETDEDTDAILKLRKRAHSIKTSDIVASKQLFDIMGVHYIHLEDVDADSVLKFAIDNNIADACFSGDMDTIAYGCKHVIQDLDFLKDFVTDINYEKMLEILGVDRDTLLNAFIMSGTDYNNPLKKTTFAQNLELAKQYKTIDTVIENLDAINKRRTEDEQVCVPSRFDWKTSLEIYNEQLPNETIYAIKLEFTKQLEHSEFLKTKDGYNTLLEYGKKLLAIKSLNSDDCIKVHKYIRKFEEYVKIRFLHVIKLGMSYQNLKTNIQSRTRSTESTGIEHKLKPWKLIQNQT